MVGFALLLPAYNEGPTIRATLERLEGYFESAFPNVERELIVVDDGSVDDTVGQIEAYRRESGSNLRLLMNPANLGLAAALETAAAATRMAVSIVVDADLSYAPETLGDLWLAINETRADCALASPYSRGGAVRNVPFVRRAASVMANGLLSWCAGGRLKTLTGMVRAYRTRLLCDLLARRGVEEFNSWSVADMLERGLQLVEVPAILAWPEHRANATRLDAGALWRRTASVLRSAICLLALREARFPALKGSPGTFVPHAIGERLISRRR